MVKGITIPFFIFILITSCSELDLANLLLPLGTSVNSRVAESLEWNRRHGVDTIVISTDIYCFYASSDIHAETSPRRFAKMVQREKTDSSAYFHLMLGDAIARKEAQQYVAEIVLPDSSEYKPCYTIVGNHDLFFGNWEDWINYFHTSTYYFLIRTPNYQDLYIMLDSANGTLGEKQTAWLKQTIEDMRSRCRHCIVCLHTNILKTDHNQFISGNFPLEETYFLLNLFAEKHVEIVLQGHDHHRDEQHFNGVTYITLDDLKDNTPNASYLIVNVGYDINYSFIPMGNE